MFPKRESRNVLQQDEENTGVKLFLKPSSSTYGVVYIHKVVTGNYTLAQEPPQIQMRW